jgi:hypothetical protein
VTRVAVLLIAPAAGELGLERRRDRASREVRRVGEVALDRDDHRLEAVDALLVALERLREGLKLVVHLAVAAAEPVVVDGEAADLRGERAALR